jgi:hypothetical protein
MRGASEPVRRQSFELSAPRLTLPSTPAVLRPVEQLGRVCGRCAKQPVTTPPLRSRAASACGALVRMDLFVIGEPDGQLGDDSARRRAIDSHSHSRA